MLTNLPVTNSGKITPISEVLDACKLVDSYIEYPTKIQKITESIALIRQLREIRPDVLIYLMPSRTKFQLFRDWIFFKLCGITNIVGLKFIGDYQKRPFNPETGKWMSEAQRLVNLLDDIGEIDLTLRDSYTLALSENSTYVADIKLSKLTENYFFVFSVGTKVDANDWGENNWIILAQELSNQFSKYNLVLIGSIDEYERSATIAESWKGQVLNLCGMLTPQSSAAVLKRAALFFGHNSGPLHLAASVGTPLIGIFSASTRPGEWFPLGGESSAVVIYHQTECFGCGLQSCQIMKKKCIQTITVQEVIDVARGILKNK
jgi:heptosyltransferase-3